jgi:hypothetical protein
MYVQLLFRYFALNPVISKKRLKIQILPALEAFLKDSIIKSKKGSKYIIADRALSDLIRDISKLNEMGRYKGRSPIIMGYQLQLG